MSMFAGMGAGLAAAAPLIEESERNRIAKRKMLDDLLTAELNRRIAAQQEQRAGKEFLYKEPIYKYEAGPGLDIRGKKDRQGLVKGAADIVSTLIGAKKDIAETKRTEQTTGQEKELFPAKKAEANMNKLRDELMSQPQYVNAYGQEFLDKTKSPGIENAYRQKATTELGKESPEEILKRKLINLNPESPEAQAIGQQLQVMAFGKATGKSPAQRAMDAKLVELKDSLGIAVASGDKAGIKAITDQINAIDKGTYVEPKDMSEKNAALKQKRKLELTSQYERTINAISAARNAIYNRPIYRNTKTGAVDMAAIEKALAEDPQIGHLMKVQKQLEAQMAKEELGDAPDPAASGRMTPGSDNVTGPFPPNASSRVDEINKKLRWWESFQGREERRSRGSSFSNGDGR